MQQTNETFNLFKVLVVSIETILDIHPELPEALVVPDYTTNVFFEHPTWVSEGEEGESPIDFEEIAINFEWIPEPDSADIYPFLLRLSVEAGMPEGLGAKLILKFDEVDSALLQDQKMVHIHQMLAIYFDAALRDKSSHEGLYEDFMLEDEVPLFVELAALWLHGLFAAERV